jgi:NRAMP (natural resistance-associated macrophage protein)-like metal ion transporter
MLVLGMLGPGFVTASAGNDVGGIASYSIAGAQFGYALIWTLIPLAVSLIVVQEMAARMGAVTGKGLAALIRENFGVRISLLAMLGLFLVNTLITTTEFAGMATFADIFHLPRVAIIAVALVAVFLMVLRFDNKIVERIFVTFSLIYLAYIPSAIFAHPDWKAVAAGTFVPAIPAGAITTVVALIGTTISPYMQFFLQSAVVDKGTRERDLFAARLDVIIGSAVAIALAGFMIVASGATIWVRNQAAHKSFSGQTAADLAVALVPVAGDWAERLFAIGLLNAGVFTATVLPLATAFVICEAFGFEAAVERRFREAPVFFSLFAVGLLIGAGLVLIPGIPLLQLTFYAQVVQGMILPLELVLMLIIINRKRVMGEFTNTRTGNIIAWATVVIIGGIALYYAVTSLLPGGNQS